MTNPRSQPDPNAPWVGMLPIDKPLGWTSMDVCKRVRVRLRRGGAPKRIKVGHGGTLDPLATGLLVILVGKATKRCHEIMDGQKRYFAEIDLSHTSSTDDLEGELSPVEPCEPVSEDRVHAVLDGFVGTILQTPPAHSAMKVGGQRAYTLARAGRDVNLEARPVRIESIEVVAYNHPMLRLDVRCGKGTYIRSLARDVGAALTGGGMLTALRRTETGRFRVDDAVVPSDLPDEMAPADLRTVD